MCGSSLLTLPYNRRGEQESDGGAKGGTDGAATAESPGSEPAEGADAAAHSEKKEEGVMCAVCHDELAVGQYELKFKGCGHSFHPSCLNQWLDRSAPRPHAPFHTSYSPVSAPVSCTGARPKPGVLLGHSSTKIEPRQSRLGFVPRTGALNPTTRG